MPERVPHILEKGSDKVAYDILKQLADGPRRPAEFRAALGIAGANFFTACYLTPLAKSGYIVVAGGEKNRYLPASSIGFCARERRWSVPNPTTFTPPLGSVPRSPTIGVCPSESLRQHMLFLTLWQKRFLLLP